MFFVFQDSYVLCIYVMNILCTFHISVSWVWYNTKDWKKWYLIPPCLTLSIIRYISKVKWSNPGEGVVPSTRPQCSSYWKGSFRVALDYSRQIYLSYMKIIYKGGSKNKGCILYMRIIYRGCVKKFLGWQHIGCWWLFWPMGSNHCNTNKNSVWIVRGTMSKNKPHLITFHI